MKNKNRVKDTAKEIVRGTIKVVAGIYILKNEIIIAGIKTACNIVNEYVLKDDEPMFK